MLKEMIDSWKCDGCNKEATTHDGEVPVGWYELSLVRTPKAGFAQGDLSQAQETSWEVCSAPCLEKKVAEACKQIAAASPKLMSVITVVRREPGPLG